MSLQGIKLITFDATNTLLKFRMPPWQYYAVVARDYGYMGSEGDVKERLLDSYKSMAEEYPNFGRSKINWEEWWRQVVKRTFDGHIPNDNNMKTIADRLIAEFKTTKCWRVADGGHKLLGVLESKGITLGVISNFDPRLYEVLKSVGLLKKFKFVITSYETGSSKPDPNIFKHALAKCGPFVCPNEAIHIGDDEVADYQGAKAAGWHALLVSPGDKNKSETPPASYHVFSSLEDVCAVIEDERLIL